MLRTAIALLTVLMLQACSHPLEIVGEGDIIELSGSGRGCTLEQFQSADDACTDNVVWGAYNVDYEGRARPGWKFSHWEGACGPESQGDTCSFRIKLQLVAISVLEYGINRTPPLVAVFEKLEANNQLAIYPDFEVRERGWITYTVVATNRNTHSQNLAVLVSPPEDISTEVGNHSVPEAICARVGLRDSPICGEGEPVIWLHPGVEPGESRVMKLALYQPGNLASNEEKEYQVSAKLFEGYLALAEEMTTTRVVSSMSHPTVLLYPERGLIRTMDEINLTLRVHNPTPSLWRGHAKLKVSREAFPTAWSGTRESESNSLIWPLKIPAYGNAVRQVKLETVPDLAEGTIIEALMELSATGSNSVLTTAQAHVVTSAENMELSFKTQVDPWLTGTDPLQLYLGNQSPTSTSFSVYGYVPEGSVWFPFADPSTPFSCAYGPVCPSNTSFNWNVTDLDLYENRGIQIYGPNSDVNGQGLLPLHAIAQRSGKTIAHDISATSFRGIDPEGPVLIWPVAATGSCMQDNTSNLSMSERLSNDITQGYGKLGDALKDRHHTGMDIRAITGTPVCAAGPGRVSVMSLDDADQQRNCMGNMVFIEHEGDGLYTLYAHLDSINVSDNETVFYGDQIGTVGNSRGKDINGNLCGDKNGNGQIERHDDPTKNEYMGPHLHFEVKEAMVAGNSRFPPGFMNTIWGYTPPVAGDAAVTIDDYHPDSWGYRDPLLHIYPLREEGDAASYVVTTEGVGIGTRTGPDESHSRFGYTLKSGDRFHVDNMYNISTPDCSRGWLEIRRTNGEYLQGYSGSSRTAWVCRGHLTEEWLRPFTLADIDWGES